MPTVSQAWPGNNRFLFNCCITGPTKDTPGLVFIYSCQFSMIICFSIFMLQHNWNVSPVLPILYYSSFLTLNFFILLTACIDPGIIPRKPFLKRDELKFKKFLEKTNDIHSTFCQTCLIYRPKRASHCSSCQNCVQIFDHHCSMVGNCIGRRNYRYFVMFIANLVVNFAIFIVNLVVYLLNQTNKDVNQTLVIIIVSVIGGVIGLPILLFLFFHLYLCITSRTTREVIKHIDKKQQENVENQWCYGNDINIDLFEQVSIEEIERLKNEINKMRNNQTVENVYEQPPIQQNDPSS